MKGLFSLLYKITIELTDHSFAFLARRYFICYLISATRKEKELKTFQDLAIMDIYRGQDGPRKAIDNDMLPGATLHTLPKALIICY